MLVLMLANLGYCFDSIASLLGKILVLSVISWHLFKTFRKYVNKELISSNKRAVIITGCDTGFGNATALKLNQNGFRVYATVLDSECKGAKDLVTGAPFPDMIHVIRMDVTNDGEVSAVYQQIKQQLQENGEELWSVVNNAGVCNYGPIDWGTVDNYKQIFDVNTFGTVRVTRTFLPLIRQSRGRVVNIVSGCGRITAPYTSAYSMSKHATLSFSVALRRENRNISVSTIEPKAYKTAINSVENVRKSIDEMWAQTSTQVKQEYGQQYYEGFRVSSTPETIPDQFGTDYSGVIDKIIDAIENPVPEIYYEVGPNKYQVYLLKLFQILPPEVQDFLIALVLK